MNKKTKVLIIGSSSNLACSLNKTLKGYNIYFAGRRNADFYFNALNETLDEALVNNTFDVIINTMAAFGNNDTSSFYETEKINALGTLIVCKLTKLTHGKHLIHLSSLSKSYAEKDLYYGIYSISKKHGDELLKLYCNKENIPYTILMPSQIFDIEAKCRKHQEFLYTIIEKVKNNENVTIYGENDFKRNYVFIDDVSQAIEEIIKQKTTGEYNICAVKDTAVSEIFSITKQLTNSSSKLIFDKSKNNVLDLPQNTYPQIYSKIACMPKCPIEDMIKFILENMTHV